MTGRWVLTDDDVRALLAVLERCEVTESGDIFYPQVLAGLRELIPCDDMTFQLMEVSEQRVHLLEALDHGVDREVSCDDEEYDQLFWQEFWNYGGCAGPVLTGDYTTVLRDSDLWTERAYANTPMGSFLAASGIHQHKVLVPMAPYGPLDRRLLLFRDDGPDFTEREVDMLRLVRPHLAELHARRDRELRGEPNLTPRQWEILRRVATGASNIQIARSLGLSDATVRKHLENIFLRLHVMSRTEALAHVRPFLDAA
ncbi:LuxR C-terminal-related transcriptional regulator [Nocardioides sp. NPDC058538]|uniref:helix-turn-helix transcriptional regulator n=1 Tax=Nocardioides sp. NPDC058538 TaxID=3346542 RepID=UPI00364C330A